MVQTCFVGGALQELLWDVPKLGGIWRVLSEGKGCIPSMVSAELLHDFLLRGARCEGKFSEK